MKTVDVVVKEIFNKLKNLGSNSWKQEKEAEIIKQEILAMLDELEKILCEDEGKHLIVSYDFIKQKIAEMKGAK